MRADNLVFDGRHMLFRTSDAFRVLTTEINGREIECGGMYGFLSVATRLHQRYGGKCWVAWEGKKYDNFRIDLYSDYKKKKELDEHEIEFITSMVEQEKRLMAILRVVGVRQHLGVHCEADDVMGLIAQKAYEKGESTIIYTGDSDLRQLVKGSGTNHGIAVVSPARKAADVAYVTSKDVKDKHGVYPVHIPDLKALAGDSSDNIPGIRGIGPKTAVTLIEHFGDIKKVILAAATVDEEDWPVSGRFRQIIVDSRKDLLLFKKLTTIKCDVQTKEIFRRRDAKVLRKHLDAYKFRSLLTPNEFTNLIRMGEK